MISLTMRIMKCTEGIFYNRIEVFLLHCTSIQESSNSVGGLKDLISTLLVQRCFDLLKKLPEKLILHCPRVSEWGFRYPSRTQLLRDRWSWISSTSIVPTVVTPSPFLAESTALTYNFWSTRHPLLVSLERSHMSRNSLTVTSMVICPCARSLPVSDFHFQVQAPVRYFEVGFHFQERRQLIPGITNLF